MLEYLYYYNMNVLALTLEHRKTLKWE